MGWTGPGENTLHTLVLGENVTVTVGSGAKLVLGGQYTSSSSGLGGQTCGAHSDMLLSDGSRILVQDGGILSAMGYITGSGSVSVTTGGRAYEPFVVTDYHGGTYTVVLYMTKNQTPFNSYAMINIQCPMTMDSSSFLYGYCDLYAGDGHNTTTVLMVGPADGVLNLAQGTRVSFTYDESRQVASHYGIGKTTLSISGSAALGYMTLTVSGTPAKTNSVLFPVPYNLTVVQESGTLAVNYGVKVLPGDEVEAVSGYTYDLYTAPDACSAVTAPYATAESVRGTWATGFSVTFDANGGAFADGSTQVVSEELAPNKSVTIPAAPARADGTFVGWEGGLSDATVSVGRGDVVYKAQWLVGFGLEGRILSSAGGSLTVEMTVDNHTSQSGACRVLAAVYDKDDRMLSVELVPAFAMEGGGEHTDSFTVDVSGAAVKVKLFLTEVGYAPAAQALPLPLN